MTAVAAKTGASFARGSSKQDYSTPVVFLAAVRERFGINRFAFDLAATVENARCEHFFGDPDRSHVSIRCDALDALAQDWRQLRGDLWLNPPFDRIAPWAAKCAISTIWSFIPPRRIFFLVPAAVGANWWRDSVHEKALVLFLNGRLSFDGKNAYPKDCALCCYGFEPGYECWNWRKS
jgi:phage N-6-adenine-methyltransferase